MVSQLPAMLSVIQLVLIAGLSHAWKYSPTDKPEGWPGLCIDGTRQSPIDLVAETAGRFVVEPLEFFNFKSLNGTLENNGHSIAIHFDEDHCDSGVTGGMLRGLYVLHEMHFHWDSEHTVNGDRFPLELHLVHYNSKYSSFSEAIHHHPQDALAVVGVLFEESENGTEALDPFLEVVKGIAGRTGLKDRLPSHFNPLDFLPEVRSSFYRYSGSLTTPPCDEIVTWTIMETKVPVSKEQMEIFKLVHIPGHENDPMDFNYRRLQDLNKRDVYLLSDNGAASISCALSLIVFCLLNTWLR
ncbi:carbonic anhydrase-like [Macrosteles quadrilineatus]|uniref:carbonic anhydrase-like n=1 Tax=Macrosteles quadrilineatus TaxID=74068 RepID=UPI0023E1A134|nr:carbonic anhydrase-like [Macrosteles quadrilineatus]